MTAAKQIELAGEAQVPAEVRTMGDGILSVIARAAADPNVDIDKLERLLEMQERVLARDAKAEYMAALAEMQPKLPVIGERGGIKDRGGNIQSTYALWEDINEAIKPVLAEHRFALSFKTRREASEIIVTGILSHAGGHSEQTELSLPSDTSGSKNAVQAVGSSTSYGKRYTASALLNLTSRGEDDDGQKGGNHAIDEAQYAMLVTLLETYGASTKRFLDKFKIKTVNDLPASKYDEAVQALHAHHAAKLARAKEAGQ